MSSIDTLHRPHHHLGSSSKPRDQPPSHRDQVPVPPARQQALLDATDPTHSGPPLSPPDSSARTSFGLPGWKRLINNSLAAHERASLITAIFSNRDKLETIRHIDGDDAQAFVDVVYEVSSRSLLPLSSGDPTNSGSNTAFDQALDSLDKAPWVECLRFLCKICGRQTLLPRQLAIVASYDRTGVVLGRGGFADVWKGISNGRDVAIKVLGMRRNEYEQIRRVSPWQWSMPVVCFGKLTVTTQRGSAKRL